MDLGPLDQQVRIEQQGVTTDAVYGPVQSSAWTELDTTWASVDWLLPRRGTDDRNSAAIRVVARIARVRMRYREDIDPSMRLVLVDRKSMVMRISSGPVEIGRRDGIEMLAEIFTTFGDAP